MKNILVVAHNAGDREFFGGILERAGYAVHEAAGFERAQGIVYGTDIDLAVVVEDIDLGVTSMVRKRSASFPVIKIDAKHDVDRMVAEFAAGVDDVMISPVDKNEFLLRVRALIRRRELSQSDAPLCGGVKLNQFSRTVIVTGKTINLPKKEFQLLYMLLSRPGKVFSREELMDEVWGMDCESDSRTVDVHIKRLREKLRGIESFIIATVHGKGYKAEPSAT